MGMEPSYTGPGFQCQKFKLNDNRGYINCLELEGKYVICIIGYNWWMDALNYNNIIIPLEFRLFSGFNLPNKYVPVI